MTRSRKGEGGEGEEGEGEGGKEKEGRRRRGGRRRGGRRRGRRECGGGQRSRIVCALVRHQKIRPKVFVLLHFCMLRRQGLNNDLR